MTVAIDLVIIGIQEPVRFAIETKAKIFNQNEKFWYFMSKPHTERFHVHLKQVSSLVWVVGIYLENFLTKAPPQQGMKIPLILSP